MRDYQAFKKTVIRYWERRRIWYNLALIPPTLLGYGLSAGVSAGVEDPRRLTTSVVLLLFVGCALGANVCYSFGYALEFLFGSDDPQSRWTSFWRRLCIILGTLFAMLLALFGGRNIAWLEYYYR